MLCSAIILISHNALGDVATWDLFFVAHICLVFGKLALGKVQDDVNISVSLKCDAEQQQCA